MKTVRVGLCEGRHEMPVSEYIFPAELDPKDINGMYDRETGDYYPQTMF